MESRDQVVAIDACGKVLWTSNTGIDPYTLMRDRAQLVAVGDVNGDAVIQGLDPASGAVRWSVDLLAAFSDAGLDVGRCLAGPSLAESNQGQILAVVPVCGPDAGPINLVALDQGGAIE